LEENRITLAVEFSSLEFPIVIDPTWSSTGAMAQLRIEHTATHLPSGKVLIAGGYVSSPYPYSTLDSCEIFNPATATWSAGPPLLNKRWGHGACALADGRVLVRGGQYDEVAMASQDVLQSETYDETLNAWIPSGQTLRGGASLTLLDDGRALAVGCGSGTE